MSESVEQLSTTDLVSVAGSAAADAVSRYWDHESQLLRQVLTTPPTSVPEDQDAVRARSQRDLNSRRIERDSHIRGAQGDPPAGHQIGHLREIMRRYDHRVDVMLQERTINQVDGLATCRQWLVDCIAGYRRSLTDFGVPTAENASEPRVVIATYIHDVTELLLSHSPSTSENLSALRAAWRQRDASLRLCAIAAPAVIMTRLQNALRDYDTAIGELMALAARTSRPISEVHVDQATRSLAARIDHDESTGRRWLWVWFIAAGFGLLAIVGGFVAGSRSGDLGWTSASIVLAGLGAVLAATYTYAGRGGFPWWSRTLLIGLPLIVLTLALVLPGLAVHERTFASLLASIVVLAFAGVSTWIVWRDPNRRVSSASQTSLAASFPQQETPGDDVLNWALIGELEMIRRQIAEEVISQRVAARWWAASFITVGGLAALLSGAAGVTAAQPQDGLTEWIAPLAIGGAGLTALTTALNPGRRWEQAQTLRLACQSLEQEVRVLLRVDLDALGRVDAREKLEEIAIKYDTLLGAPERPRLWRPPSQSKS